ncbi:MAG: AAA family ATPase, partial [Patulibacter sp.]|nr:AAA family ATPase [Patulibacter sp.]
MTASTLTSNHPGHLLEVIERGEAALLSGTVGAGKTHLLRAVSTALTAAGREAPVFTASALGRGVPMGAFAGAADLPPEALGSPTAVIDAFSRRRSSTVLLVDDVDELDEASLYVVTQLITTAGIPAVLASRDLTETPEGIRALYDSGDLVETPLDPLPEAEAVALVSEALGGPLTPSARAGILAAGNGNPLHLREIVRGSVQDGRLTETPHGWELQGPPTPTPRLAQLVGERFRGLDEPSMDAATIVSIAVECPTEAIGAGERRALARAGVVELSDCGWIRLSHPLDGEFLRSRCSAALWRELARDAVDVLRTEAAGARPAAARQADVLALEHGFEIDVEATVALAEHALGAFDEHLALRAAEAVTAIVPEDAHAHRIAGLAASALDRTATADEHLSAAHAHARTDVERTSVALARAQHRGLRHHDAAGALAVVHDALESVRDPEEVAHLQRAALRWGAVAGQAGAAVDAPEGITSPAAAMGLITIGVSAVITGPLREADDVLPALRRLPAEHLAAVPGGHSLIGLTEIMALSYTGDVLATRRRLRQRIADARQHEPESLGIWEYALGLLELLSADAEEAYALGRSAAKHLAWRDSTGLLPAAQALIGAAAAATGRGIESREELESIPEAAAGDPKVVMLRAWADAWQAHAERRVNQAALVLLDAARWLLTAQHTYLSGMLAHCAVRLDHRADEGAAILRSASTLAGGGLLRLLTRHAEAVCAGDAAGLEQVASDALELGIVVTAADSWLWLANSTDRRQVSEPRARRHAVAADELCAETPGMALWARPQDRSTLLTDRERQVARLAANRFTAKEIAAMNGVSANTVTNQLASVFRKLGIGSRAELDELLGIETDAPEPIKDCARATSGRD